MDIVPIIFDCLVLSINEKKIIKSKYKYECKNCFNIFNYEIDIANLHIENGPSWCPRCLMKSKVAVIPYSIYFILS